MLFPDAMPAAAPRPVTWGNDPAWPNLQGERRIILNAETKGVRWWADDEPIGFSWLLPQSGRMGYAAFGHVAGNNTTPEQSRTFLERELRGIHIDNANTKFDLHTTRRWGVDLTEQGNTFSDVQHKAALIDDNRYRFNIDQLSLDFLRWDVTTDPLGKLPAGIAHEGEFWKLPAWVVAPYAIRNVMQVHRLNAHFDPIMAEENLGKVFALECDVIPVVVEMEKNGTYVDRELLEQWRTAVVAEQHAIMMEVFRSTGLRLDSFDSPKQLQRVWQALSLPILKRTETGAPSFDEEVLRRTDHPMAARILRGGQLADLDSKYLSKYLKGSRTSDGWLRYNLHQLRVGRSEEDKKGTVSGRFSAAGDKDLPVDGLGSGGYNPQQCVAVEKQVERGWCTDYVIRKAFLPGSPSERHHYDWFCADMMQVEYRLFAHYADMAQAFHDEPKQKMIGGKPVWIAGPLADFHALVSEMLLPVNPALNRKLVKNINFANIYGAGLAKFALMLGEINEREFGELAGKGREAWKDPRLQTTRKVKNQYDRMFPKVAVLLKQASEAAKHRGYVCTLDGRRARLMDRFHSALNRVIQGGAADINKRVIVEVYKVRKALGLTMTLTVHDELDGNLRKDADPKRVEAVLNEQRYDLKAPILWDCGTGETWADAK